MRTILTLVFLAVSNLAYSLNVQCSRIYIVSIGKKTASNELWLMNYIVVNDSVYSGNYFTGYNFTCDAPKSLIDSILKVKSSAEEEVFVLKKKIDKMKMNSFHSNNLYLNSNFFWTCVSIEAKFVVAPCKIKEKDFLSGVYGQFNGFYPISVNLKSFRKQNKLPSILNKFLEQSLKE